MTEDAPFLPGLSPVVGKPVHVAFDGGRMSSDAGVLLLAEIERRLGLADRLAHCIEDPRAPDRVRHSLAEMIRFRTLMIAAGYEDANDCDALRGLAPKTSFWRDAQFDTLRLAFVKIAARVTELVTRIKVSLPSSYPYKQSLVRFTARAQALPP